jgi:hypothetical protein
MPPRDSTIDPAAMGRARALLKPPVRNDNPAAVVAAAAFFALTSLGVAVTVISVPPVVHAR